MHDPLGIEPASDAPVRWPRITRRCGPIARIALFSLGVLLSFSAVVPVRCAEGLYLSWNDCARSGAAAANLSPACADTVTESLLCAFILPQALDSVIAVEVVLDLQHSAASLPPWWQLGPGGCREAVMGSLVPSANIGPPGECQDFWQGQATTDPLPFIYDVGDPRGRPNQARMRFFAALPSASYRSLNGTDMYYAIRLRFRNSLVTTCAGCGQPACLVLNSIWIGRLEGARGGNLLLQVPGPGGANRVTWQGNGADCSAVPVQRTSWGRLKTLYR